MSRIFVTSHTDKNSCSSQNCHTLEDDCEVCWTLKMTSVKHVHMVTNTVINWSNKTALCKKGPKKCCRFLFLRENRKSDVSLTASAFAKHRYLYLATRSYRNSQIKEYTVLYRYVMNWYLRPAAHVQQIIFEKNSYRSLQPTS